MAPSRQESDCESTFVCEVAGKERRVHAGDVIASSDPVVKGRKELFEPVKVPTGTKGKA